MKLGKQSKKIAILTTLLILVGIAVVVIMAIAMPPTQNTHEIRLHVSEPTAETHGGYVILEIEIARLPYADSANIGWLALAYEITFDYTRFVPVRFNYPAGNPAQISLGMTDFLDEAGWALPMMPSNGQLRPDPGVVRFEGGVGGTEPVMSGGSIFMRFNVIDGAPLGAATPFAWRNFSDGGAEGGMSGTNPGNTVPGRLMVAGAGNTAGVTVVGPERTVTFDPTGGTFADGENGIRAVSHGLPLPNIPANPTRGGGYVFSHWSLTENGPDNFNPAAVVEGNFTVWAVWNDPAIVTFNVNLSGAILPGEATRAVVPGESLGADMPGNPSHTISAFVAWNTEQDGSGAVFTSASPVPASMTVFAQWRTPVTVTFNANGGTLADNGLNRTVFPGESLGINMPGNPSHATDLFGGWRLPNGDPFTAATIINENITVTAHWIPDTGGNSVTVTFDPGTGSLANAGDASRTLAAGTFLGAAMPANATHASDVFAGWYISPGNRFTENTIVNSDMTVTASFQPRIAALTVTFDARGGVILTGGNTRLVMPGNSLGSDMVRTPMHPAGHAFEGWNTEQDGSGNWFTAATAVNADITVYAIWAHGVRVTFNGNQGTIQAGDEARSVIAGRSLGDAMPPNPTRGSGYTFVGWFTQAVGGTEFTAHTSVMQDIEVFARWEAGWTVTFNANGGDLVAGGGSRIVARGQSLGSSMPADPSRDNHEFIGWSTSQTGTIVSFNDETPVTGNITVFARWMPIGGVGDLTVTFNANGGTLAEGGATRTVAAGQAIGLANMPANPSHATLIFAGWEDSEGNPFDHTTTVNADMTVSAQWEDAGNAVTVNFSANGGVIEPANLIRQVIPGNRLGAAMPVNPTRDGHAFTGWLDASNNDFTADTVVQGNMTVTAQWTPGRTITFNTGEGDPIVIVVIPGQPIGDQMPNDPADRPNGSTFDRWVDADGNDVTRTTVPTEDMTVEAKWNEPTGNNYVTVTFAANNGTILPGNLTRQVIAGSSLGNAMPPVPTRTGHAFTGWEDADGNAFTAQTTVQGNMTVTAQWAPGRTITFNTGEGDPIVIVVIPGQPIGNQMPSDPADRPNGSTFDRWVDAEGNEVTDATIPSEDMEVKAEWNEPTGNNYVTVTFAANGGVIATGNQSRQVIAGNRLGAAMPVNPTRAGYVFAGWQNAAGNAFTAQTVVQANMTVTAQWVPAVTVTFAANGGTILPTNLTRHVIPGTNLGNAMPPNPIRSGHVFAGWHAAGSQFTASTVVHANMTVTAQWTPITGGGSGGGGSALPPTPPSARPPAAQNQQPPANNQDDNGYDQPGPGTGPDTGLTAPPAPGDRVHQAFMVGFPDGTVRPHANVTRAEVATIVFRLTADSERTSAWSQANPFPDVSRQNWFNNAVSTMTNAGVFTGMPDGTFQPSRAITRAEFAVTMARHFGIRPAGGADMFTDISGHWGAREINALARAGMISGRSTGIFAPNELITRAEAAALVTRMLGRQFSSAGSLLPEMQSWSDNMNQNSWFYIYVQDATNSNSYVRNANGTVTWMTIVPSRDWRVLEREYSRPTDIIGRYIAR